MKSVYDYFVDYASAVLNSSPDKLNLNVLQGIADYLKEMDLFSTEDADGCLSSVEFARFRLMRPKTLETFFEFYSVRSKIETIKKESELLALNRIHNGKTIPESVYHQKLDAFYTAATDLAADKRYSLWLDRTENDIVLNLRYALGKSREISVALHEKIEMFGER